MRKADPRIAVTLVEANATYTALPHSNAVIAGLIELRHQQFGYDRIKSAGVNVALSAATAVDPEKRAVTLADGTKLNYERLVVSPGIDFRSGAIQGYDRAAMDVMPPAYNDGAEVALLRRQLEAMEDGGTVVIASPVNPARCPPAPYERASLIAHYLKTQQAEIQSDRARRQGKLHHAEAVRGGMAGALSRPDRMGRAVERRRADLDRCRDENARRPTSTSIRRQSRTSSRRSKAGRVAELAGVADRTGWCPVDPVTFASKLQPNIHVIGDAAIAGAMPRSASAAHSQAQICAAAIAAQLAGKPLPRRPSTSSCYSLIAPDYAISQKGTYRPVDDQYTEADGGAVISAQDAPRERRKAEADEANAWFRTITGEVFG